MKDDLKGWGELYRTSLAELIQAKYRLRATDDGLWELKDMPTSALQLFSSRRQQILDVLGQDPTTAQKQYACLKTRPEKETPLSLEALREHWHERYARLLSQEQGQGTDRYAYDRDR